jgi:hypothetical protein
MGRQLQSSKRHGYSVRTLSLIGQVVQKTFNRRKSIYIVRTLTPYYENCVQQKCNHLNARATLSGRGSIKEIILANLESLGYRPDAA